jgi:hypothetical protein
VPKACHKITRENEIILIRRMVKDNMGQMVSARDILAALYPSVQALCRARRRARRHGFDVTLAGGWFAVQHKDDYDRLIYDRRPANATELRFKWSTLPHGSQLAQLVVPTTWSVRGSLKDLRAYFFCLSQAPGQLCKNAVGREWGHEDFPEMNLNPHDTYYLCLRVQGMGDLNAVDIAQEVHEHVLRRHGALLEHETLRYGTPVPAGTAWEGVYVDDHLGLLLYQPTAEGGFPPTTSTPRDVAINAAVTEAYRVTAGLEEAKEKEVNLANHFTAWGTHVDGVRGTAGTARERRAGLICALSVLVAKRVTDRKTLERTVHAVTHPLMHRSECLAVFGKVYLFMHRMSYGTVYRIPVEVRLELAAAALLLPIMCANLRWDVSTTLAATDATPLRRGTTRAAVPYELARELYRGAAHNGEYTRLDWVEVALARRHTRLHRCAEDILKLLPSLRWIDGGGGNFGRVEHVNIQELQALLHELRHTVTHGTGAGIRKVVLVDSRVVVGAWAKGRSSAQRLNSLLRSGMAWQLFGRVKLCLVWVPTDLNPSDDPSRDAVLRAAVPLTLEQLESLKDLLLHSPHAQFNANRVSTDSGARDVIDSMFVMPLDEDGVSNDLGGPSTKDAFDFVGADIEGNDRFDSISEDADRGDDGPRTLREPRTSATTRTHN